MVGLLEGVRSGYFAGLLPFYAPEHLGLGPAAFTLAFTLHQLAENLSKAAGGLLAERLGYGLTVTLAAATGLLALLLTSCGPGAKIVPPDRFAAAFPQTRLWRRSREPGAGPWFTRR